MVIKNLENKVKLVGIICGFFLFGCILISVSSIWTARTMVVDAQQKVYVLEAMCPFWYSVPRWRKPLTWNQKPCGDVPPLFLHIGSG